MTVAVNDKAVVADQMSEHFGEIGTVEFANLTHVWLKLPTKSCLASVAFRREYIRKVTSPNRVEGQPIAFEDVLIGDVVTATTPTVDNGVQVVTSRTGTVGHIDAVHRMLKTRGGSYLNGQLLTTGGITFVLVTDVEKDAILMEMKSLTRTSIISYRTGTKNEFNVAVKIGDDAWNVMHGASNKSITTLALREHLKTQTNDTYTVERNVMN